ncbi:MAG TPA: outer membrane protein assembly factor BamD [Candidatus Hydrogenedentes bacterium]|nr:outer membrane protein assembly factor BamD [Candidatus Hydrogenedentota bacterium]
METRIKRVAWVVTLAVTVAGAASAQWTWAPQTGRWINVKRLPKETAELQLEFARSLFLKEEYKRALRETDKFQKFYGDDELADENLFLRGQIFMADGKWLRAAKELQLVISEYPESDLFDRVIELQYAIGDRYHKKGEANAKKRWRLFRKKPFKKAIEVYTMVIDNQPFTDAAAEAQYKVGLCQASRGDYLAAAYEYRRVIEDYSSSDWVDDASYGLAQCYYEASLPSQYDQTPSALAVRAMDEFLQRYPEDQRSGEIAEKRVEMRETIAAQRLQIAHFYKKRRDFDAARLYYEVVVEQFGDTQAGNEAAEWLAENPLAEKQAAAVSRGSQ